MVAARDRDPPLAAALGKADHAADAALGVPLNGRDSSEEIVALEHQGARVIDEVEILHVERRRRADPTIHQALRAADELQNVPVDNRRPSWFSLEEMKRGMVS